MPTEPETASVGTDPVRSATPLQAAQSKTPDAGPPARRFVLGFAISFFAPLYVLRNHFSMMRLPMALVVHMAGLVVGLLVMAMADLTWYGYNSEIIWLLSGNSPTLMPILELGIGLVAFEFAILLGAVATQTWAAKPEPWRNSFDRSLTRWYQLTPWHVAVVLATVFVVHLIYEFLDYLEGAYWDRYNTYSYSYSYSWIFEMIGFLVAAVILTAVGVLLIWRTLGAMAIHAGGRAWASHCLWPAVCEGCGYSLAGSDEDRGCPECGRSVAESLSTTRTNLTPSVWQTLRAGVFRPRQLGQGLATHAPLIGAGPTLAWSIALVWTMGFLSVPTAMLTLMAVQNETFDGFDWESFLFFLFGCVSSGAYLAVIFLTMQFAVGWLVGTSHRVFGKRNRMHTAGFAAVAASGIFLPWAAVGVLLLIVFLVVQINSFSPYGGSPNPMKTAILVAAPILMLLAHACFFITYIVLVSRIVGGTRHANT